MFIATAANILVVFALALVARLSSQRLGWIALAIVAPLATFANWLFGMTAESAMVSSVVALIVGLIAPELWTGLRAWLQQPKVASRVLMAVILLVVLACPVIAMAIAQPVLNLMPLAAMLALVAYGFKLMLKGLGK